MLDDSPPLLMRVSYQLTEKEFYEAQVQHKGVRGTISQIVGAFVFLAAVVSLFTNQYANASLEILLSIGLLFGLRLSTRFTFKREPSLGTETTVVLAEDGLEFISSRGRSDLNWSAFVGCTETKDLFMLYVQSQVFQLIPKRIFLPAEISASRELLQRHIPVKTPKLAARLDVRGILLLLVVIAAILLVYFATHRVSS